MGKRSPYSQLERVAYHEAGHAVSAIFLRIPFDRATIIPGKTSDGEEYLGIVEISSKFFRNFHPDISLTPRTREKIEDLIINAYAGTLAEKRYIGRHDWRGAEPDLHSTIRFSHYAAGGEGDIETVFFRWLRLRTDALIDQHWNKVQNVANALLDRKTLSAMGVREVMFPNLPIFRLSTI